MHFNEFQDEVVSLASKVWPEPATPESLLALLLEETGELSQAVRKLHTTRLGHDEVPGTKEAVIDELGDVLFLLARIADASGVWLSDAQCVLPKIRMRLEGVPAMKTCDELLAQVQAKIERLECLAESWRKAWKHEHDMRIVFEDRLKAAEELLEAARKEG